MNSIAYPADTDFGDNTMAMGWVSTGVYYHTTADGDIEGMVSMQSMEKATRAHAYVIDELSKHTEAYLPI